MLPMMLPSTGIDTAYLFDSVCGVGKRNQYLGGWLFVMPATLDRGELGRLVIMNIVADEMPDKQLDWKQYRR